MVELYIALLIKYEIEPVVECKNNSECLVVSILTPRFHVHRVVRAGEYRESEVDVFEFARTATLLTFSENKSSLSPMGRVL